MSTKSIIEHRLRCPMQGRESEVLGPIINDRAACSHCNRKVSILTGKSLLEIAAYLQANPDACIIVGGVLPTSGAQVPARKTSALRGVAGGQRGLT